MSGVGQPMTLLVRFGRKPHPVDRKKYGAPRVALFWAERGTFTAPGLHLWTGSRHVRILPLPRRSYR